MRPSDNPTQAPTIAPSPYPSYAPSNAPTFSQLTLWSAALDDLLTITAASEQSSIVETATYFELDVSSQSTVQSVYGSCSTWRSLLSGSVASFSSFYKASSIEFVAQTSLEASPSDNPRFSCESDVQSVLIMTALLTPDSLDGGITTVSCGSHDWKVKQCGESVLVPALCVDCADPCSTSSHCLGSGDAFTIAPCVSFDCGEGETVSSAVRVLSFGFEEYELAPAILSLTTNSSKTEIAVSVQLMSPGTVYCSALEHVSAGVTPSPSSLSAILLQNNVATTGADNSTVVTIDGLFAATGYQLYCMSVSPVGVQMLLDEALAHTQYVETECCVTVTVESTALFLTEDTSASGFLSVSFSRPRKDLQVSITAFEQEEDTLVQLASNPFFPSSFTVKGVESGGSLVLSSSLESMDPGVYSYVVSFVGETAAKYEAVYAQSNTLEVIQVNEPLPAPVLRSAVFANDGSYVTITFDSKTDKGGVGNEFTCALVFEFTCASTSTCRWSSSAIVNAFLDKSAGCASLGGQITLSSSVVIKALCEQEDCDTSSWESAVARSTTIAAPASPISPSVAIASPISIGGCDSLTLDVSGSSGSGGRAWTEVSLTVESTATRNVSDLQTFLRDSYHSSPPTPIPAALLQKGFVYNFAVKLCNFLGACSQGSRRVSVLSTVIPSLTLPGSALRRTQRSAVLSISSYALVVDCDGSTSRAGLLYQWSIKRNGVPDLSLVSTSKDPSKLKIPAYTLTVGSLYAVSLVVTIEENLLSTTAAVQVQVLVEAGSIVAVVSGGTSRTMRVEETLNIDASASYDEDQNGVTGTNAGLQYTWSCVQTAPLFRADCSAVLDTDALVAGSSIYQAAALSTAADTKVEISLSLLDSTQSRAAAAVVTVSILPALSPVVSVISNLGANAVMNTDRQLRLTGTVSLPAGYSGSAVWTVDDSRSVNLDTAAKSPLAVSFTASSSAQTNTVYLVLGANSLPIGFSFTLSLSASMVRSSARPVATVTVRVNSPPLPGTFSVTPESGTELTEPFEFAANAWSDQDLPLQYQFGYVSSAGVYVVLRSRTETAFGKLTLPAGAEAADFSLSCTADIFDSYSAVSTSLYSVTVTKSVEERNSSETLQFITGILAVGSSSADGIKQSNAVGSYLLNTVNCTLAPNCSSLNRLDCYRTAHTCGDCLSGDYVGEAGDSNERCVSVKSFERSDEGATKNRALTTGGPCSSLGDCSGFEECVQGICTVPQKQCAGNCSSHGICTLVDDKFGTAVADCKVGASGCIAVCDCEEDYWGSETCSVDAQSLADKQFSRVALIQNIRNLMDLEDADVLSITGWMNSLSEVALIADELSSEGAAALLDAASKVIEYALEQGVDGESIQSLLASVDAAVSSSANSNRRRRRLLMKLSTESENDREYRRVLESGDGVNANIISAEAFLQQYSDLIAVGLLPGQDAVQAVLTQFRLYVQRLSNTAGDTDSNTTIAVPTSALESVTGAGADSIVLPSASGNSLTVSVRTFRPQVLNDELGISGQQEQFHSNALTLELSQLPCSSAPCNVEIELQVSSALRDGIANAPDTKDIPTYETTCGDKDFTIHNYSCPDSTFMLVNCTGTASVITSQCPTVSYVPACNALVGYAATDAQCSVVSVADTSITCSCPLGVFGSNGRRWRRVLQSPGSGDEGDSEGEDGDEEVSVSYVAMLESVETSFVDTVLSVDDLSSSDAERGWAVIVTLGMFVGLIIIAAIWSHYADIRMHSGSVHPNEKQSLGSAKPALGKDVRTIPISNIMRAARSSRGLLGTAERQRMARRRVRIKSTASTNSSLLLVEEALPKVLSSRSLSHRVGGELQQHHRWFGIYFHYSAHFPRVLRLASLTTNVVIMLFIQSLTYSLTNPDTGECEDFKTRSACLEPESPYATGDSKCYWSSKGSSDDDRDGSCSFVEPDEDYKVILFVAIFSAVIATPVALLMDWVIMHILAAPAMQHSKHTSQKCPNGSSQVVVRSPEQAAVSDSTSDDIDPESHISEKGTANTGRRAGGLVGVAAASLRASFTVASDEQALIAQTEFRILSNKLQRYRDVLTLDERIEFDGKQQKQINLLLFIKDPGLL